jgi:sialic acid synthase SpsE
MEMIRAAANAGAQAVKFQTFRAGDIAKPDSPHFSLIRKGELDPGSHRELFNAAAEAGVDFLSTPFSPWAVDLLEEVGVSAYKIASMDCINKHLLKVVAGTGKPIFMSTGMATLEEIADSLEFLDKEGCAGLTLLHCIAEYPAPAEHLNLETIVLLRELFGLPTGYSDHYPGVRACIAAAFMGADVIETHFTLDNSLEHGDHSHSADPGQLKYFIETANSFETMRGNKAFILGRSDRDNAGDFRRGVYAARDLAAGEVLSEQDLLFARPASELSPSEVPNLLGRRLRMDVGKYSELVPDCFDE